MALNSTNTSGWGGTSGSTPTTSGLYTLPSSPPTTVTTTITIPGDPGEPATPEERIDYPPLGWTASANSIDSIFEGLAGFRVDAGVHGAVVGLTSLPAPAEGYSHIQHGLMFTGGRVISLASGTDLGAYTSDDWFFITFSARPLGEGFFPVTPPPTVSPSEPAVWQSIGMASSSFTGGVVFERNGDLLYSDSVGYSPGERFHLAASLYGPQDAVFDPYLEPYTRSGASAVTLPGLKALSGTSVVAQSLAVIGALGASSGMLNRSSAGIGRVEVFSSDRPLGQSVVTLPRFRVSSYNSLPVAPNNESFAIFTGLGAASTGITGGVGSGTAGFSRLLALSADRVYAASEVVLGGMEAASFTVPGNMGVVVPTFGLWDNLQSQAVYKADAPFGFGLGIAMSTSIAANERIDLNLGLDVPVTLSTIDTAEINPVFWFDAPLECPGAFMDAWAVNLDNGASTEYRSYPFETVANIGGRYFGAASDGLYELAGDTDAGAPIDAKFDIGRKDFGDHQLKRVENVYLGITSKGQMFVKVSAEGASYTYPMREFGEHIQTQRVTVGKGMRANYFGFEIGNTAGCDFEITSLNMTVAESARRI